ncbi:hypothetical protein BLOT_008538 [Blomia tropicalis]|nr:hypothetical protein BLOT_008538 [Blomia tropicalis]
MNAIADPICLAIGIKVSIEKRPIFWPNSLNPFPDIQISWQETNLVVNKFFIAWPGFFYSLTQE